MPFLLFVRYEVQRALLLDNHHNHNNNYFSNDIFEAREVLIGAMERPLFPFDILKRFGVTDPGSQDRSLGPFPSGAWIRPILHRLSGISALFSASFGKEKTVWVIG